MAELLDLSKVVEHDTVKLPGGAERELINRTDLGVLEYRQVSRLQAEASKLTTELENGKLTAAREKRLLLVLGHIVRILIPTITTGELGKLGRAQRELIVLAWLNRNFTGEELAGVGEAQRRRRTTGASSRGSRRSTAATRKRGSGSRSGR